MHSYKDLRARQHLLADADGSLLVFIYFLVNYEDRHRKRIASWKKVQLRLLFEDIMYLS